MEALYYLGKGLLYILFYGGIIVGSIAAFLITVAGIIHGVRYVIWKLILKRETSLEFVNRLARERGYESLAELLQKWEDLGGFSEAEWGSPNEHTPQPEFDEYWPKDSPMHELYSHIYEIYLEERDAYYWGTKWYCFSSYNLFRNKKWFDESVMVTLYTALILIASWFIIGITYYAEHGKPGPNIF